MADRQRWEHSSTLLSLDDGVSIPHPDTVHSWEDNMAKWPNVTTGTIISYFMESMAVDGRAMENLKGSEAYQYLHSNKVGCVLTCKHDRFVYLKSSVEPSQCVNNSWHNAWVVVTEEGVVETAGCSCVAGPGRSCSHVAAILWKVENAVRQGKTGLACTDGPNQWNAGARRNAGQQKMKDVRFKRHKRNQLYLPSTSSTSSAKPAHEYTVFKTLEDWRKSALASPMAAMFTCSALAASNSDIKMTSGGYHVAYNGPRGYYQQVQLGMYCTGLTRAMLVIWHKTEHIEIDVPFNQAFVQQTVTRLRTFYFTHMLPKVVDEFVQGKIVLCPKYHNVVKLT